MKYKVGDRVRIVSEKTGDCWNSDGKMDKWLGKVMTIDEIYGKYYLMKEDYSDGMCTGGWNWYEHMVECKVRDEEMTEQEYENRMSQLQAEIEKLKKAKIVDANPFNVGKGEVAYYNDEKYKIRCDDVWEIDDIYDYVPCKDASVVNARQKRQHLSDLLEKFAYDNNAVVTPEMWEDAEMEKYYIINDVQFKKYRTLHVWEAKHLSTIYFTSAEVAERAIKEVVEPFMRGEL